MIFPLLGLSLVLSSQPMRRSKDDVLARTRGGMKSRMQKECQICYDRYETLQSLSCCRQEICDKCETALDRCPYCRKDIWTSQINSPPEDVVIHPRNVVHRSPTWPENRGRISTLHASLHVGFVWIIFFILHKSLHCENLARILALLGGPLLIYGAQKKLYRRARYLDTVEY
jgi:hypothetical protein